MAMKAIFVDKDGTLIDNLPGNVDPARIRLSHRAKAGMMLFACLGFKLVIVSNQAALATGQLKPAALRTACGHLLQLLDPVRIAGIYICPHAADSPCACRKPKPGMLVQAAQEHGIDLAASWMIGDILHDVEAGKRAGCRTVLIDNGNETEWELSALRTPDLMAADLLRAAHLIRSR